VRRRVLAGGAAVAAVVAAGGWLADRFGGGSGISRPVGPPGASSHEQGEPVATDTSGTVMQIIAHPDDDLYFMNPEVARDVTIGRGLVSVYLTCGEADGINDPTGLGKVEPRVSWAAYAAARQEGLRRAYGQMAIGNPDCGWNRQTLVLAGGKAVELDTMAARPQVQLVFFNLPEAHDTNPKYAGKTLTALWHGTCLAQPVIPVIDSMVTTTFAYRRAELVAALADLLARYDPGLVRTTNPDPQHLPSSGVIVDHPDHTAAALFVYAALEQHRAAGHSFQAESYLGYDSTYWPEDLDPVQFAQKAESIETYGWANRSRCAFSFGCGDLKVGAESEVPGYTSNTEYRYQAVTSWLTTDQTGALRGYATVGGDAATWQETAANSSVLRGPSVSVPGPLTPRIAVTQLPDGRAYLAGVRMDLGAAVQPVQGREIVITGQGEAGGAFADWTALGNPDQANPAAAQQVGSPVIAGDASGNIYVFVRNYGFALYGRMLPAGGIWGPWLRISDFGIELQDGISAVTTADGGIAVVAAGRFGLYLWTAPDGAAHFTPPAVEPPAADPSPEKHVPGRLVSAKPVPSKPVATKPPSPFTQTVLLPGSVDVTAAPGLVALPGAGLVVYYRPARDASINAVIYTGDPIRVEVGRPGGYGAIAAAVAGSAADPAVLLVTRNDSCTVSYTWHSPLQTVVQTPDTAGPTWQSLGGSVLHAPSITFDAHGRAAIGAFGTDGVLRLVRQTEPGPDGRFTDWQQADAGAVEKDTASTV
jgi:LmbE family N-acetylglucosaminyl deacetylase